MTLSNINRKLRKYNFQNYIQFILCTTMSVIFIVSFIAILNSPMVQNTFPEGGDSRKQVYMIFAVTVIGCWIFVLYATSLFLRYKSKETGVLLALGLQKRQVHKMLSKEVRRILYFCIFVGVIVGCIISFFVWQIFRSFFVGGGNYMYHLTAGSVVTIVIFCVLLLATILVRVRSFIRRNNLMDIIYEQRKSEPVKMVGKLYGVLGIVLALSGIFMGYVIPILVANTGTALPSLWSLTYVLSVVGLYMCIVYIVVHHNKGRNLQKYYQNIISYNIMRFQGRQTVNNMCVLTLLIVAGLFAFFYVPQLGAGLNIYEKSEFDFSLPYRADSNEVDSEYIEKKAQEYGQTISQYNEVKFAELIGSGVEREWDDNDNLVEDYQRKYKYFEFISESAFEKLSGEKLKVSEGKYYLIISPESNEGFWYKYGDLDYITNPETKEELKMQYEGTIDYISLLRNGVTRYILNDNDYELIAQGLSNDRKVKQILFSIAGNEEKGYQFATDLYSEFLSRAPENMAVESSYDEYQSALADEKGVAYDYDELMELSIKNPDLMSYWKYYPIIKPIIEKQFFQSTAIFFLLFLYAGVISIVTVGIISYTRTITISNNNYQLFIDLKKLGANKKYLIGCLSSQVKKIFVIPLCIGSVIMTLFTVVILRGNDNKFSMSDMKILIIDLLIILLVMMVQMAVYKCSLKKAKRILEIG